MKIGQKFTLLSLIALFQVAQLCGTTWDVEVGTGDEADITKGVTVGTLVKKDGGRLKLSGLGYDVDHIKVDDGDVYVDNAPGIYLSDPFGTFIAQPATLAAGITYLAKLMAFIVDVPTGLAYVEDTITSPLLEKTGNGMANFITNLIIHYLKISAGGAIISQDGVPVFEVQLGGLLQGSSNLDIPTVTMIANGTINNASGYSVIIRTLVLEECVLSTDNASTVVDMLDASPSGGTIANTDHLIINGAAGDRPITKQALGTMTAAGDLSGATIPIDVLAGKLQVSGDGKLPTANVIIDATGGGSTFELSANLSGEVTAGAVPGYMEIQSGCVLEVDAGLTVPAANDANDVFTGGLKVASRAILKLGDGAVWKRAIHVGYTTPHS